MKQITRGKLIVISIREHISMDVTVPIFIIVIGFKLLCTNALKKICSFANKLQMVTAKSFSSMLEA